MQRYQRISPEIVEAEQVPRDKTLDWRVQTTWGRFILSDKHFRAEYKPVFESPSTKTLDNTCVSEAKEQVSDLKVYGDGNLFKLLSKASSAREGWMKSTKAMNTPTGVVIQVTTQQGDNIAEALTFVPGVFVGGSKLEGYKLLPDGSEEQ